MNRRELMDAMLAGGALAAAAVPALAAEDHSAHAGHAGHAMHHGPATPYGDLVASASACASAGAVCLTHCLQSLATGDTELARCAALVRDLVSACTALRDLAASGSPYVKALAPVVSTICRDCEAECRKHAHPECQACEKSCADCRRLCEKLAA
ncbi:MAG: hypothetical protein RLZZ393_953 [Pseudomonadota bacterium]|jgi:Cys-rich four helix bundle protein (predicted Tat secretion target)